jgi:hypothetical protein
MITGYVEVIYKIPKQDLVQASSWLLQTVVQQPCAALEAAKQACAISVQTPIQPPPPFIFFISERSKTSPIFNESFIIITFLFC